METPRPHEAPASLKLKKRQLVKHSQILQRFIILSRPVNWARQFTGLGLSPTFFT